MYFKNMNDFAEKNMADKVNIKHNGLFEKNNIEWYKLSDFKNSKNMAKIRPHYTNILNAIVKNEKLIIKELETKKNLY